MCQALRVALRLCPSFAFNSTADTKPRGVFMADWKKMLIHWRINLRTSLIRAKYFNGGLWRTRFVCGVFWHACRSNQNGKMAGHRCHLFLLSTMKHECEEGWLSG